MFWPNWTRVQRYGSSESRTHDPKNSAIYCSSSVERPNKNCRALRFCSHGTTELSDFTRMGFIGASGTVGSLCHKSATGGPGRLPQHRPEGSRHTLGCGFEVVK